MTSRFSNLSVSRPAVAALAAAASVVLVLAGCSANASSDVTSTIDNVEFTPCTPEVCETTVNGYPIKIQMPGVWNGSLLIFSQGYRGAEPIPPAKSVPEATPQLAPIGSQEGLISDAMRAGGYAVAGAAVPDTGWQVDEQIKAAEIVKQQFVDHIAQPNRIYAWGESTGALASVQLGQTKDWVNGVAGYCGLLAGFNKNYDLALDAAFAVKTLLYPEMKLTGYKNIAEAEDNYDKAMEAVNKAAKDTEGNGSLKLYAIAAAAAVPMTDAKQSGNSPQFAGPPIASNLKSVLARTTVDRFHLEKQFGGNPSSNIGTNYATRVTNAQVEAVAEDKAEKAFEKYLTEIQLAKRIEPDQEARAAAGANGNLTGEMKVPTVTLHTEFDPLAIVQNEGDLVAKTVEVGNDSRQKLSPTVTSPPLFLDDEEKAKYGVGHCKFTDQSIVGLVGALNEWVRNEKFPTKVSIAEFLGPESGVNTDFTLYTWPGGALP